jgi:phosphatidylglycerophosphate synthase
MIEPPKKLRKICQKQRESWYEKNIMSRESWYIKGVIRKVSIYITWLLLHTPITANQVTVLFIVIGLIGVSLFGIGIRWCSIIGVGLLYLYTILDYVDGEIARYRKTSSPLGSFIELVGHNIVNPLIFIGISFGVFHNYSNPVIFLLGFLAAISLILLQNLRPTMLHAFEINTTRKEKGSGKVYIQLPDRREKNLQSTLLRGIRKFHPGFLFSIHGIELLILVGAIFDRLYVVLFFYGVTLPIYAVFRTYRNIRQMKSCIGVSNEG